MKRKKERPVVRNLVDLTKVKISVKALDDAKQRSMDQLGVNAACRRGCSFCCTIDQPQMSPSHARVAIAAARHLGLESSIERAVEQTRMLGGGSVDKDAINLPCPMLSPDGECGIYSYRPVACILTLNDNAEKCRSVGRTAWDPRWEPSVSVIMGLRFQMSTSRMMKYWEGVLPREDMLPMTMAVAFVAEPELTRSILSGRASGFAAWRKLLADPG